MGRLLAALHQPRPDTVIEPPQIRGVSDAALRRGVVSLAEGSLVQAEEPLEDP
jgi:hypothetical protein